MTDLSKNIIYEDHDILAIDKPAGLVVHPDGRTKEPSVSDWFVEKYPEAREVGEPMRLTGGEVMARPGIVHRLDRETSGVLLLAKTQIGFQTLKEQFRKGEIEKIYHLFVYGILKDDRGTVNLPIGRSTSDFRKRSAQRGARGEKRVAVTYFQVLKRADDKSATFVEARPKTGRTHQIRVHFKALNHPVVCDKLYAPNKTCLLGFNRLALHAHAVTFRDVSSKTATVEAPYPEDFQLAFRSFV